MFSLVAMLTTADACGLICKIIVITIKFNAIGTNPLPRIVNGACFANARFGFAGAFDTDQAAAASVVTAAAMRGIPIEVDLTNSKAEVSTFSILANGIPLAGAIALTAMRCICKCVGRFTTAGCLTWPIDAEAIGTDFSLIAGVVAGTAMLIMIRGVYQNFSTPCIADAIFTNRIAADLRIRTSVAALSAVTWAGKRICPLTITLCPPSKSSTCSIAITNSSCRTNISAVTAICRIIFNICFDSVAINVTIARCIIYAVTVFTSFVGAAHISASATVGRIPNYINCFSVTNDITNFVIT